MWFWSGCEGDRDDVVDKMRKVFAGAECESMEVVVKEKIPKGHVAKQS